MKSVDNTAARLAAVAHYPQPWQVVEEAGRYAVVCRVNAHFTVRLAVTDDLDTANFIAHAPFDIDHLLKRVAELEQMVAEANGLD